MAPSQVPPANEFFHMKLRNENLQKTQPKTCKQHNLGEKFLSKHLHDLVHVYQIHVHLERPLWILVYPKNKHA